MAQAQIQWIGLLSSLTLLVQVSLSLLKVIRCDDNRDATCMKWTAQLKVVPHQSRTPGLRIEKTVFFSQVSCKNLELGL